MTGLAWGDPLPCRYTWIEPTELAGHAEAVGHVARKTGAAASGLEALAGIPETVLAGLTADAVGAHAGRRSHEASELQGSLREVSRAIHAHADMLAAYRDGLGELLRLATERGLEVRHRTIWPPEHQPPPSPTQQQYDAWVAAWRSYRTCFDLRTDLEAKRREHSRDLARALTAHTGARPQPADEGAEPRGHGSVDFGRGHDETTLVRRTAAEPARRVLAMHDQLESTLEHVARLRQDHRLAVEALLTRSRAGAPDEELTALAREVRLAAEALRGARSAATGIQAELAARIS